MMADFAYYPLSPAGAAAAAVGDDDDDVEAIRCRDLVDHAGDRRCFVEGRDDEAQRLHRIPQF
jgi:hypothetical protein